MWAIDPGSLDPALPGQPGSSQLLNATCAKLYRTVYPETGTARAVPEVAVDDPKITNGGRTYTFDLKRTFRFHTGEPVIAQSFKDAFDRAANPKLKSPASNRGYLREIVGIEEAMKGTAETISGVRVLGRYRLQIRLTRRAGDFVARLTMPYFCPILPGTPPDKPIAATEVPASGPYRFVEHTPNRQVVLERNRYYRGERTADPDRIVWTIERDERVKALATERGTNDFTPVFAWPTLEVGRLVDKYGVNRRGGRVIRDSRTLSNFSFRFNTDRPAFKGAGQKPLRKAIVDALDRHELVRAIGYQEGRASGRLLPAALRGRLDPVSGPNLAAARKWLARAKVRPPTLTLYMPNYPWSLAVAEELESNLRPLRIELTVEYFELTTLGQKLLKPGEPWDLAWSQQGAPYPDPAGALFPHVRDTRYEARFDAANRMADAARAKALAKLEADLMSNDPLVAVWADFTPLAFVSNRFGCWGADSKLDLAAVCKR
jgi:ABC-type oligopeptide transport system substrate-binding subunit